ncbi:protein FmtA [Macrococcus hajekii]|nr:serine hydrolase domain-containing protein [Macrococcus hajekii]GGA99333.1 protein FmtA [Macrococcus hajekii]
MKKIITRTSLLVLSMALSGCNILPSNETATQTKGESSETQVKAPQSKPAMKIETNEADKKAVAEIKEVLKAQDFNGTIFIAKNNKVIMNEALGQKNSDGDPLQPDNMFLIGSSQKFLTGLVVRKLEDEGLINRNQQLSYYLPEFNGFDITIKNLLMHRSGFLKYETSQDYLGLDKTVDIIRQNGVDPAFHNVYNYNDANYIVLAKVIEQVTKKSYKENVQHYLIKPLHLSRTGFYDDKELQPYFAEGFTHNFGFDNRVVPYGLDQFDGAGNIYMSAQDMGLLARAFYDNKLFSADETTLLKTNVDDNAQPYRYGFNVKRGYLRLRGYFYNQEVICWFDKRFTLAIASNKIDPKKAKHNEENLLKVYNIVGKLK